MNPSARAWDHVLLTRFNVRLGDVPASDAWVSERLGLFARYCLPSVRSQQVPPTAWLVLVDESTARPHLEALRAMLPEWGRIVVQEGVWASSHAALAVQDRREHDTVITTRLDNDDAIAAGFLGAVSNAARRHRGVISLPVGYQLADRRVYRRVYLQNPFISLVEAGPTLRTVLGFSHADLAGESVRHVWTSGSWLQVIHGGNIGNAVRGVPVAARAPLRAISCLAAADIDDRAWPERVRVGAAASVPLAREAAGRLRRGSWRAQRPDPSSATDSG